MFDSGKGELYTILSTGTGVLEGAWFYPLVSSRQATTLSRFRTANHWLPIETGRWSGVPRDERKCPVCNTMGDEYHHLFECDHYTDLREPLSDVITQYRDLPRNIAVTSLLNCNNKTIIHRVAKFLTDSDPRSKELYELNRPPWTK